MLSQQLTHLGLSQKEAEVYLAVLELGSDTVQKIAQKAKVNRATTYVVLESLIKKGIITTFEKGKKRFFAAEPPERLNSLLRLQEQEIREKEKELESLLPELRGLLRLAKERPTVKFYEGVEGLKAIQDDIRKSPPTERRELVPLDEAYKIFPPSPDDHREELYKRHGRFLSKTIYSSERGELLTDKENLKFKYISPKEFKFSGEIVIYGDKVAIFSYKGKLSGVVIESPEIAETFNVFFDLAWKE